MREDCGLQTQLGRRRSNPRLTPTSTKVTWPVSRVGEERGGVLRAVGLWTTKNAASVVDIAVTLLSFIGLEAFFYCYIGEVSSLVRNVT